MISLIRIRPYGNTGTGFTTPTRGFGCMGGTTSDQEGLEIVTVSPKTLPRYPDIHRGSRRDRGHPLNHPCYSYTYMEYIRWNENPCMHCFRSLLRLIQDSIFKAENFPKLWKISKLWFLFESLYTRHLKSKRKGGLWNKHSFLLFHLLCLLFNLISNNPNESNPKTFFFDKDHEKNSPYVKNIQVGLAWRFF